MYSSKGLTLVQHAELDINEYYFQVIDTEENPSKFYDFPDDILQLGDKGYVVDLGENGELKYKLLFEESGWKALNTPEIEGHKF
jgi:hypothetical protein